MAPHFELIIAFEHTLILTEANLFGEKTKQTQIGIKSALS
jgi:hypothetical protein